MCVEGCKHWIVVSYQVTELDSDEIVLLSTSESYIKNKNG